MEHPISVTGIILIAGTVMLIILSIVQWLLQHIVMGQKQDEQGRIIAFVMPLKKLVATILLLGCQMVIVITMVIALVVSFTR